MIQTSQPDGSTLSPEQGNRLIRLFQESFDTRSEPAVSPATTQPVQPWQPMLTDLTGRVVHALDPLLVQQPSPTLPPVLRWVQPDAPAPVSPGTPLVPAQPSTSVSDAPAVARPTAKPTL